MASRLCSELKMLQKDVMRDHIEKTLKLEQTLKQETVSTNQ